MKGEKYASPSLLPFQPSFLLFNPITLQGELRLGKCSPPQRIPIFSSFFFNVATSHGRSFILLGNYNITDMLYIG